MKRLSVQALESRKLLAADIGVVDTTLHISGTEGNDIAEVYTVENTVMVKLQALDADGQVSQTIEQSFDADLIDGIIFEAFGGDDLLVNDTSIDSIMRAGGGNDVLMGGAGHDILVAGGGDDIVLGGGGDDVILGGPGDNLIIDSEVQDPVDSTPVSETPANETPADEVTDEAPIAEDTEDPELSVDDTPLGDLVADSDAVDPDCDLEMVGDDSGELSEESSLTDSVAILGEPDTTEAADPVLEEAESETIEGDAVQPVAEVTAEVLEEVADPISEVVDEPVAEVVDEPVAEVVEMLDCELGTGTMADSAAESVEGLSVVENADSTVDLTDEAPQDPAVEVTGQTIQDVTSDDGVVEAVDEPIVESLDESTGSPEVQSDVLDQETVAVDTDATDEQQTLDPVASETGDSTVQAAAESDDGAVAETDNDVLFGGTGNDWIFGEGGDDTIFGANSPLTEDLLMQMISNRLA